MDVLTEQINSGKQLLTAIECEYAKKKVIKDVVIKLSEIMDDSGIQSGIIVCKAGYTKDAVTFAAHKCIKLIELWKAGENDAAVDKTLTIGALTLNVETSGTRPKILKIDFGSTVMND